MFYKHTTDITHKTESEKKDKQAQAWASPKRKKGEFLALFWHSVAIARVYPNEIPTQQPGTQTHPLVLADLACGSTSPNSSLQQPPLSNRPLFLTVANFRLLIALEPCLSSSSSRLAGNLVRKPFVWVSHQNQQRNPLTGADPHPHPQNECPPSCLVETAVQCLNENSFLKL